MASLTVYPDAHTESTSVDGEVASATYATFALARNATTGTANDSATTVTIDTGRGGGGNYSINRGFFLFDTSALGDSDTVTAATLSLYVNSKINNVNDGTDLIAIITTNPASNTSLTGDDFDNIEGTDNVNPLGTGVDMKEMHDNGARLDITSISTGAYNSWAFNSTGLGYISLTGVSKFGATTVYDTTDAPFPGGSGTNETIVVASADTSGTSSDPKLEVTYTPGVSGVTVCIGGGIIGT